MWDAVTIRGSAVRRAGYSRISRDYGPAGILPFHDMSFEPLGESAFIGFALGNSEHRSHYLGFFCDDTETIETEKHVITWKATAREMARAGAGYEGSDEFPGASAPSIRVCCGVRSVTGSRNEAVSRDQRTTRAPRCAPSDPPLLQSLGSVRIAGQDASILFGL
jgi:hypothetical protein